MLEALREPMEEGEISVSRASGTVVWPARFMMGAAMNPCPCGYSMDPKRECTCLPEARKRYREKISGPLLDRIDIQVSVPPVDAAMFVIKGEGSHLLIFADACALHDLFSANASEICLLNPMPKCRRSMQENLQR